ncbi:50S ribosomal protein L9 [Corynebacterium frankenforstense DSM 45800]|uniref:Large ribosomal subunit protein bL9 n=1 Tax=Corynebacterium frankenforstense DSM 45800 TaxID=1437875 RepID=A0A1L7CV88_9CORY|nr:50S ribosomal protein L9 [Corynebacterium frankenforstense]APT89710.1 50S ribosomal protein L9 [Corynebacterium frankenforstense DSM 45800]
MKLILTAAVENLGDAGDVVEVRDGYARNYLLPRSLAIQATRGALKQIDGIKRAQEARAIRDLDHAREVREQVDKLDNVKVSVRTSDKGKLFGSVKRDDIVDAVRAVGGPALDKRAIELPKTMIKTTGKYTVRVQLHPDIAANLNFEVVAA